MRGILRVCVVFFLSGICSCLMPKHRMQHTLYNITLLYTGSCRLGPWSEWSDCQERESRCVRLRSQEKLEPSSGDHDLIPYKEDCSQPAIEVEDCSPSECENFSKRLRRVFWY